MSKPKFHVAVKNAVQGESLELYFLDYIADGFDWFTFTEINMVADTIAKVKEVNPSKIKLTIDSQGGDASIGLAIYNFLRNYDAKIETDVVGMAGSIASVIAMAAGKGKLKMARNSFMVIHRAWGVGVGNSDELRAAADVIDKYTAQIVDVYSQRTGKSKDEIQTLIANGDFWMAGQEAVEMGFADEIYNDNAQFKIAARVHDLSPNYRNIPKNLAETETPNNIFSAFKNNLMEIINSVKQAFAGIKAEAPAKFPQTVEAPMLLAAIEEILQPTFATIEEHLNRLENFDPRAVADLQSENTTLRGELSTASADILKLQEAVANLIGGAAVAPAAPVGPQPIGKFS